MQTEAPEKLRVLNAPTREHNGLSGLYPAQCEAFSGQNPDAKLDIPHFHIPESTPVDQSDEQFMLQEFGGLKHAPDLFPAENYRKFLDFWNGGKMEVAVR